MAALQGLSTTAVAVSLSLGPPALLQIPSSRLYSGPRIPSPGIRIRSVRCKAAGENQQVYNGVYGPWTVESSDVQEVLLNLIFSYFNFYLHFLESYYY
jgi:hypothetical protein